MSLLNRRFYKRNLSVCRVVDRSIANEWVKMSGLFYGKFYEILKGNFEPIFTTIKLTNCMYTFGDVVVSKKITVKYCSRSVIGLL